MMEEEGCEYDWSAIQERLAFLLYQFATRVIDDDFKVDPLAADNAVQYCEDRVAGGPYIPARQERFWDFIYRHGGSLEWVAFGDITGLVCRYASTRSKLAPYRGLVYELDDEQLLA